MNRRQFMQAFGAAAASMAVPSAIASVFVDPYAKYRTALEMYDKVLVVRTDAKTATAEFDKLMTFVRENFAAPIENEQTLAETKAAMTGFEDLTQRPIYTNYEEYQTRRYAEYIKRVKSVPPQISESIWPIALLKLALKYDRLPLDPSMLTEFAWFHNTYGNFIIQASE